MSKVVCFSHQYHNTPATLSDSIDEALSQYKDLVDEFVSLDDLTFIMIPDDLPQVRYKQVLVPV